MHATRTLNEFLVNGGQLIVPNGRVAAALHAHFALQQAPQTAVWVAPDVQALDAWLTAQFDAVRWEGDAVQLVLNAEQERALWMRAIAASDFGLDLAPAQTAVLAQDAWSLMQGWGLSLATVADATLPLEQQAFRQWAIRFQRDCRELAVLDPARAIAHLPALAPIASASSGLWDAPPALQRVLPAPLTLRASGDSRPSVYRAYPAPADEIAAAVAWATAARARAPTARVVIAVADPKIREILLREVVHGADSASLSRVFAPQPYRVALRDRPRLIEDGLTVLTLTHEITRAAAAQMITSPYLLDAAAERGARARAAARVLQEGTEAITLAELSELARASGVTALESLWHALRALTEAGQQRVSLQTWMNRFEQTLQSAGWPGPNALTPRERQAHQVWNRALDTVGALDLVLAPQALLAARERLRDSLANHAWTNEAALDAIDILSLPEAAALAPEYVWIAGLHDAQFPPVADANPLLPYAALRQAGVPSADRNAQLQRAERWLSVLQTHALECVMSLATQDGDLVQSACHAGGVAIRVEPPPPVARRAAPDPLEDVTDAAVPLSAGSARGGVAVLTDQAACAFRAFARHRLSARPPDPPALGPTPRLRGDLVHRVLALVWRTFETQAACATAGPVGRAQVVAQAVAQICNELPPRAGHRLERARLLRLVLRWLDYDLARPAFTVIGCETARTLQVGDLQLALRIDRIDRLACGDEIVLDYKTGSALSRQLWDLPRPEQPQLLAYALTAETTRGIAFAALNASDCKIIDAPRGIATKHDFVVDVAAWALLREAWQQELTALASAYAAGTAEVAPKSLPETCRHCDLQVLCRIYELEQPQWDDELGASDE